MFRGTTKLTLDAKSRLAIPSRYRERVTALCDGQLVLTSGVNMRADDERRLELYPLPEFEELERKLGQLSGFDPQVRQVKSDLIGFAHECDLDGSGRILVPTELRQRAGIERNVVLVGFGSKFELWDQAAWERQQQQWQGQEINPELSPDLAKLAF